MNNAVWAWSANPAAPLVAALISIFLLCLLRRHRDEHGKISSTKIVATMLLAATAYILLVTVVSNFVFHISISETITDGFGNDRVAWLFFGLLADTLARLYALFDTE